MPLSSPPKLAELEDDLLAVAIAAAPDLHAEAVTSLNPASYNITAAIGVVLLVCRGGALDPPKGGSQIRRPIWQIFIGTRDLRPTDAHRGAYGYVDDLMAAYTGHQIGPLKWYVSAWALEMEKAGVFWYSITVSAYDQYTGR